jgi:hypothetical protein
MANFFEVLCDTWTKDRRLSTSTAPSHSGTKHLELTESIIVESFFYCAVAFLRAP